MNRKRIFSLSILLVAGAAAHFFIWQNNQKLNEFNKQITQLSSICRFEKHPAENRMKSCTTLIEMNALDDKTRAYAYYDRSLIHKKTGDIKLALADLDESIKLLQSKAWIYSQRSYINSLLDNRDAAYADLEHAENLDPDDARVLGTRGYLLIQDSQYEDALVFIDKALGADPEYKYGLEIRPFLLRKLARHEEEIDHYINVLARDPEATWVYDRTISKLIQHDEKASEAAEVLKTLVRAHPQNRKLTRDFILSCMKSDEKCPALYPESRNKRPELSCKDALSKAVELNPDIQEPHKEGALSAYDLLQDKIKATVVAAAGLVSKITSVMSPSDDFEIKTAQEVIVYDRLLDCNSNGSMSDFVLNEAVGEPGQEFNDIFNRQVRENILDLAYHRINSEK